jgi:hypothetical protein
LSHHFYIVPLAKNNSNALTSVQKESPPALIFYDFGKSNATAFWLCGNALTASPKNNVKFAEGAKNTTFVAAAHMPRR